MRSVFYKILLLCFFITGLAYATEMRTPWISERGPIRYIFEPVKEDGWSLDVFAIAHRKEAQKAYKDHGFETSPLSSLFFNKSDFAIADAFPNATMSTDAKYYNPYLEMTKIHPRVTYYESGVNLGARFECPVYKDIGRFGIRVNVPLRSIEIEREDITDKTEDPEEDYILARNIALETGAASDNNPGSLDVQRTVKAYSFDLLYRLFQDSDHTPAVQPGNNTFRVFGQELVAPNAGFANNKSIRVDLAAPVAGVIYKKVGSGVPGIPNEPQGARDEEHWAFNNQDTTNRDYTDAYVSDVGQSNDGVASDIIKNAVFFGDNVDYTGDNVDPNLKNNGWLIFGYDNGALSAGATNIKNGIDDALKLYQENPYEWLWNHGNFEIESQSRTGLGDIDIDFFYEHRVSDKFIAEAVLGFRLPTGCDSDYSGNPYKVHLGNGEHFEIKLGGMLAWQPTYWINAKLDSYFSFVLSGREDRAAVFTGSTVKNIGPKVDADVDWQYFVLRLDTNLFHPQTEGLSATLGYELYIKGKDNIDFKQSTITPFYGDHYDGENTLPGSLNGKLAAANTDGIGHKLRVEVRSQLNEWVELIGGGSIVFAGKNVPRDSDLHCGFSVKF